MKKADKTISTKESKAKTKVIRSRGIAPIFVLCVGIILGGILIGVGIYKNLNSDYDKFNVKTEDELKNDIKEKISKVDNIRKERNDEYDKSAVSDRYLELSRELSAAEGDLSDTEAELFNVQTGFYDNLKKDKVWSSVPLITIGAVVIVVAIGLCMKLNTSKKKNVILTISEEK